MRWPDCTHAVREEGGSSSCGDPAEHFFVLEQLISEDAWMELPVGSVIGRCARHRLTKHSSLWDNLWRELSEAEMAAMEVHGS